MIPDAQVEEVRGRADLVDIIGELVPLKKAGREFKACCPFHEERTPSFFVVPEKGFYKCFGCGESGDIFAFVMKRLGLDFVEAVKHVAARSGVEIREVTRGRPEEEEHRGLYELNAFAREFYRESLRDPGVGRRARDYLASRGIDPEAADRFGLGYAPADWRGLRKAAATHGFEDDALLEAGLLTRSDQAPEPYDRFRDRLIFPIETLGGRVVAFGGRVLGAGEGGPKYLNSPETPIYHKGHVLYGLSWGKNAIRREGAGIVVEGYMDVVALAAAGVEHVVATLGTAMTEEQAALLARYAKRAFLLFDSDEAGLRATFRAGDILLAGGVHPAVVTLPPGEDPDTLVRKEGPAGLRHYLDQALDILDRKLQILEEKQYFRDIDHTRGSIDRLLPTLRATADAALRDIYVAKVAEKTGVRRETLEAEMRKAVGRRRGAAVHRGAETATGGRSGRAVPSPSLGPERMILHVLMHRPEWAEEVGESIGPEDFLDPVHRRVFEYLLSGDLDAVDSDPDPRLPERVMLLRGDAEDLAHAREQLESSIRVVQGRTVKERLELLRSELGTTAEDARRTELMKEMQRVKSDGVAKGHNQGAASWAVLRDATKGS